MPHYYNSKLNYYISTSHKVASSHLAKQANLQKVHWLKMYWRGFTKRVAGQQAPNYLLVRNPYDRLESFFRGKTKIDPERKQFGAWQHCQLIILRKLGIENATFLVQKQALLYLSFEEFIKLLPSIYKKDGHLTPQVDKCYVKNMYDNVLRIEKESSKQFLENDLGISMQHKTGTTKGEGIPIHWSPSALNTVKQLYHADFSTFNYEVR